LSASAEHALLIGHTDQAVSLLSQAYAKARR
jgi:hypothetical protein